MSIRKKRKRVLRWQRWERKIERLLGPENTYVTRGSMKAYNAHVHQWNRKQNRALAKEE